MNCLVSGWETGEAIKTVENAAPASWIETIEAPLDVIKGSKVAQDLAFPHGCLSDVNIHRSIVDRNCVVQTLIILWPSSIPPKESLKELLNLSGVIIWKCDFPVTPGE